MPWHHSPTWRRRMSVQPFQPSPRDRLGPQMALPGVRTQELFAPLAKDYERWAAVLSMGQDARWRRRMVANLGVEPGDWVLDVAAGTGSITRLLQARGAEVVSLDLTVVMLAHAVDRGATGVIATGEGLPFPDASFDAVTFGYLLRYVESVPEALTELARVVRPGGAVGMVEFGRPTGLASGLWHLYTRTVLPLAGTLISPGWKDVGRFLGPSIDDFHQRWPPSLLAEAWRSAGLSHLKVRAMSFGGGLVMTARKT